jgi:hypothetical protein
MNRSISRTLLTVAAAAATTAVVAVAGPAQAVGPNQPAIYVDGFGPGGYGNQACIGSSVEIDGTNLSSTSKSADVTEFSVFLVRESAKVKNGAFTVWVDSLGEKGNTPYHVYVYNKKGKTTFDQTVTVNWVKCLNVETS